MDIRCLNYKMVIIKTLKKIKTMVLITGASRGIGKYLFSEFHKGGDTIYGTYNRTPPEGKNFKYFQKVDISCYDQVANWIDNLKPNLKSIILINCAGINYSSFAHKADLEKWTNVVNVNLIGTFNVINKVLPIMREQNFGRIINLSSVVAQTLVPGTSAYAASKAGLSGLIKSIAAENATKGITINNLTLGYFNAGMIQEVPQDYQELLKKKIPLGEFGNPVDIFSAIQLLINSNYINGSNIDINGGLT